MGKKKTKRKKMEFCKIIFLCTSALFTMVVIGSFLLMWHVGDISALVCLISTTASLVTVTVGYYMWKSKAENLIRMSKENNLSINEVKSLANTNSESYEDTSYSEDM